MINTIKFSCDVLFLHKNWLVNKNIKINKEEDKIQVQTESYTLRQYEMRKKGNFKNKVDDSTTSRHFPVVLGESRDTLFF